MENRTSYAAICDRAKGRTVNVYIPESNITRSLKLTCVWLALTLCIVYGHQSIEIQYPRNMCFWRFVLYTYLTIKVVCTDVRMFNTSSTPLQRFMVDKFDWKETANIDTSDIRLYAIRSKCACVPSPSLRCMCAFPRVTHRNERYIHNIKEK